MTATRAVLGGLLGVGFVALCGLWIWHARPHAAVRNLDDVFEAAPSLGRDCREVLGPKPVVLLVLGQSNAANHAGQASAAATVVAIQHGRCYVVLEPLPGATGRGGSVWSRLMPMLASGLAPRRVAFAILAVDSTTIADWTAPTALRDRLVGEIRSMADAGIEVSAVLWQQGEADAREGTSRASYRAGLQALVALLRAEHVAAPILLARSARCGDTEGSAIRAAIDDVANHEPGVVEGPDLDVLTGAARSDGCHWSSEGAHASAALWSERLLRVLRAEASRP
jgi:hypothetical protein